MVLVSFLKMDVLYWYLRLIWIKEDRKIVVELRFQPKPIWISHKKMSCIVEVRDAKTGKAVEVWHFHIRFKDGRITHKDKKYPI